ncbi:MAG: sugar nucleotide epimerase [Myxococcales bacterium]|nr:sugar nucleotide epimerase [Myxococcales bacterium]
MSAASTRPVLVTGGAGFIGANVSDRILAAGTPVIIYDNLSRPSVERNLAWLRERHGALVQHAREDVRDRGALAAAMRGVDRVFHFAAQVAVTTSLVDPIQDFEVNARGTLNVLEAVRAQPVPPSLVYTSTNKVYGALGDVTLVEGATRWHPADRTFAVHGVSELRPLDFHSPYGCSKGAADAYVIDYARSFGLPALVFRMSCIYGPRQLGSEDQGWVAHFWRCALGRRPLTVYGDGKQVRDLLFVDDLVDALLRAHERASQLAGRAFNIGGGPASTLSLIELLRRIDASIGRTPALTHEAPRTGDQRYYVSDTRAFQEASGWRPRVGVTEGLARLGAWLDRLDCDVAVPVGGDAAVVAGEARG